MADDEYEPDDDLEGKQEYLYELIGFHDNALDPYVHDSFWDVMYNDELTYDERVAIYEEMAAYLAENYGIAFDELWDWEDFREWYETG